MGVMPSDFFFNKHFGQARSGTYLPNKVQECSHVYRQVFFSCCSCGGIFLLFCLCVRARGKRVDQNDRSGTEDKTKKGLCSQIRGTHVKKKREGSLLSCHGMYILKRSVDWDCMFIPSEYDIGFQPTKRDEAAPPPRYSTAV